LQPQLDFSYTTCHVIGDYNPVRIGVGTLPSCGSLKDDPRKSAWPANNYPQIFDYETSSFVVPETAL
jgi:hypothetical protein